MLSEIEEIKRMLVAQRAELSSHGRGVESIIVPSVTVLVVDLETAVIVYSTPFADAMFGCITGELIGKTLHSLIPDALRSRHEQHFKSYALDPKTRQMGELDMTLHGKRRDGSTFPIEIALHPHAHEGRRYVVAELYRPRANGKHAQAPPAEGP